MSISGFDKLHRELSDAQRALKNISGDIGTVNFDPEDPTSVNAAIRQANSIIDRKVGRYRNNPLVKDMIAGVKAQVAQQIRGHR
jgi:hypothetical protein